MPKFTEINLLNKKWTLPGVLIAENSLDRAFFYNKIRNNLTPVPLSHTTTFLPSLSMVDKANLIRNSAKVKIHRSATHEPEVNTPALTSLCLI